MCRHFSSRRAHGVCSGFVFFLLSVLLLTGCRESAQKFGRLTELAGNKTDKGISGHYFTEIYEHFFSPLKDTTTKILEIGVEKGGSLQLWRDYFPKAMVYGIDIIDTSELNSKRIRTFIADQADRGQLKSAIDEFGSDFDIILDDGGHGVDQQQISFAALFPHVRPGGYYIIEDVHTSLPQIYPHYGVEEGEGNSTLRMIENFIRTGQIESIYMTQEEMGYLKDNIDYCNLFFRNHPGHSITCLFKKKNSRPG